jgi:hypothetical protein
MNASDIAAAIKKEKISNNENCKWWYINCCMKGKKLY